MQPDIVPVILAGGEGRRLRPLTAPTRPKPFLRMFSSYSLLQMTMLRAKNFSAPVIICDHRFAKDAMDEAHGIGIRPRVIAEPLQRGTAGAIACAAYAVRKDNPLMLVMPSDHVIENAKIFEETVRRAAEIAGDAPVILGRTPNGPRDRYGYIRTQKQHELFKLQSFIEKPSAKAAQELAKTEGVFWNTGIFLCRAETFLQLMAEHARDIHDMAFRAMIATSEEHGSIAPKAARYAMIPAMSIDHALMEKLHEGFVLPLETGWHDVGCWERVFALKLKSLTRTLNPLPYDEPKRPDFHSAR